MVDKQAVRPVLVFVMLVAALFLLAPSAAASTKTHTHNSCTWVSTRPSSVTVQAINWDNRCPWGVRAQMRYWQGSTYYTSTSPWSTTSASRSVPSGGYGQSGYTSGRSGTSNPSTWRLW